MDQFGQIRKKIETKFGLLFNYQPVTRVPLVVLVHVMEEHFRHIRDPIFRSDWISQFTERPPSFSNDYEITNIGTFWRNGLGTFNRTRTSVSVDGDGMLFRITFTGEHVFFKNRFVETSGYVEEKRAGKPLHRGPFGTIHDDWFFRGFGATTPFKNTANTSQMLLNDSELLPSIRYTVGLLNY